MRKLLPIILLLSACTPPQNVDADGYLITNSNTKSASGLIITPNDPTQLEFARLPKCCRSLTPEENAEIEAMNDRNWAKQRAESKKFMADRKKKGLVTYEPDSTITVNIE